MSFHRAIRDSVIAQFGPELAAGKHQEFPALRRLWLEDAAARAEEFALREACEDVVFEYQQRMN